jgi:hypothetical protein
VSGVRIARRWLGWGFGLLTVLIVMHDQREVGIARDETVYMTYGPRYVEWWAGLLTFEHGVSEAGIKAAFGGDGETDNNREHPPLMKTLLGISERVLHRKLGWLDEVSACRLPTAVLAGVLIALVYGFSLAVWGWAEAVLAALLMMLMPRALFHAGLACFDVPITTLWFAVIDGYRRGLTSRRWQVGAGVLLGLALATKHNAILLAVPLGLHYAWVAYRSQRPDARAGAAAQARALGRGLLRHRPWLLVGLAVGGPLTLFACWPWLWFHPIAHVQQWLGFHLHHVHYNYEYLGANWNAPPFPWHVAVVTTLMTVPVVTLAAAGIGAVVLAWRGRRGAGALPAQAPTLLLALSAAGAMGPFFLGSTPIFGAEKHWAPAIPTLAIIAAVGVAWAARRAAGALAGGWPGAGSAWGARIALAAVAAPVIAAAAIETAAAEPYGLSWYNALAGGAAGGADLGMNRQFWGVAARGALPFLASQAPAAGQPARPVYSHDASPAWSRYIRDGLLPASLPDAGGEQAGISRSELAIVIHERHFNRHDFMIWAAYGTVQPVFVLRAGGVPIVSVYRRPKR